MIVFKTTQKTMKSVGVLFTSSETLVYKIYRCFSFIMLSILFIPSLLYMLQNYKNLIKATEACIYISAEGAMMAKAIFMYYNHETIRHILEDFQTMTNTKIRTGRVKFLFKLDREAEKICKCFLVMLVIAICIWSGGPVAGIIYRKIQKTYVAHMYGHPFKGVWPYDYETTPGYEITYVINFTYNLYVATYFAAADIFFVSCALHLIGATQDLEHFLLEVDVEIKIKLTQNETRESVLENKLTSKREQLPFSMQDKLCEAIRTHYDIIRITDNLYNAEQGIIFSQFFGVLFSLSAIVFQVVIIKLFIGYITFSILAFCKNFHLVIDLFFEDLVSPLSIQSRDEHQLFFIGPTVILSSQLFFYCYYGQRATDQALRISESIYQLNWYNYPVKYQKYLQMIMIRSQNSTYFNGFGFFSCSLEIFTNVLKFIGSVVALFRNFV